MVIFLLLLRRRIIIYNRRQILNDCPPLILIIIAVIFESLFGVILLALFWILNLPDNLQSGRFWVPFMIFVLLPKFSSITVFLRRSMFQSLCSSFSSLLHMSMGNFMARPFSFSLFFVVVSLLLLTVLSRILQFVSSHPVLLFSVSYVVMI